MKKKKAKAKVKAIPKKLAIAKTGPEPMIDLKDVLTVDTIRRFVCPEASDTEIGIFLGVAKSYKLSPFKREIYLVKYGNEFSVQVGYETYLKRASRFPDYKGFKVWTEPKDQKIPIKACVEIYREGRQPFCHEVYFDEYKKTKSGGQLNHFWFKMPQTMIKKVCVAQAHRLAYPDELGGMPYIREEINADLKDMTGEAMVTSGKPDVEMPTLIEKDVDTKKPPPKPEVKEPRVKEAEVVKPEPVKKKEVKPKPKTTNVKPDDKEEIPEPDPGVKKVNPGMVKMILGLCDKKGISKENICKEFKLAKLEHLPMSAVNAVLQVIEGIE